MGSYFGLTQSKRITDADRPFTAKMLRLLAEGERPTQDTVFLHYALGKSFDDLGEYESAIHHFDEANRILSDPLAPGYRAYDAKGYAT